MTTSTGNNHLTIQFTREYNSREVSTQCSLVDTLLSMALKSTDAFTADCTTSNVTIPEIHEKDIVIDKQHKISVRVNEIKRDGPHVRLVRFCVSTPSGSGSRTTIKTIHDLMMHLKNLQQNYEKETQRDLLGGQFYFDQKYRMSDMVDLRGNPHSENPRMARIYELSRAPKHLSFCKVAFSSNKQFSNLFGDEIVRVRNKISHFIEKESWYREKGIPHQLGICLHGPPGTGKTSVIGAIANLTKRHIVNVHCGEIQTHTQLRRLFYEEELHVYTDEDMTDIVKVKIPIDQRLYVLEELDAIPSTLSRDHNATPQDVVMNEITLAHWLQIMDDVNQTSGRILVVTTNYPERLDSALMRPGRIDLNMQLGNASKYTIAKMIKHFTNFDADPNVLPDMKLPPALVSNIIQQYIDSPLETILDKLSTTPAPIVRLPPPSVVHSTMTHGPSNEGKRPEMSGIHAMFN